MVALVIAAVFSVFLARIEFGHLETHGRIPKVGVLLDCSLLLLVPLVFLFLFLFLLFVCSRARVCVCMCVVFTPPMLC